ncbi:DUF6660 family protein [Flavobacterium microcysteis]|uniref:DUF2946 domain-containing protein n=1 Tax=Flavobacterium microcysteis TaxID=2596891 RepID=A0A501Q0H0_9FLAO|nr:DUF6660 family protein [Flavobacterium microcysteis]TPD65707.1 hypothetical protein FJA49_16090 [Flavobacterium microcysteis]
MKSTRHFLTSFLSVYLLVLMILPCNDVHAQPQTVSHTQISQLENEQHHEDFCTPFCICACCTTPIIIHSAIVFDMAPHFDNSYTKTPSFYKPVTSSFFGSIWQPPQLV